MDLLLVFPPITEAHLFPYLSLPMLSAFLRARGHRVEQLDLNLELSHRFLRHEALEGYLNDNKNASSLRQKYRNALASVARENLDAFKNDVFRKDKIGTRKAKPESVHFLTQCVELFLENTCLKESFTSFTHMEAGLHRLAGERSKDLVLRELLQLMKERLESLRPAVVGISIAFFSQIFPSLVLAQYIKKISPHTRVILGGQQVMLRKDTLKNLACVRQYVDGLGTSLGEETLDAYLAFVAGEKSESEIPDFISLKNGQVDPSTCNARLRLSDLPTPDFEGLSLENYFIEEIQFPLITCIGCYWGRCAFCSYGNRSHRDKSYQQASPEKIANDCLNLTKRWGAHRINFVDENTNLSLVRSAMKLFRSRGGRIEFSTRNRMEPALTRADYCQELRDLGCVWMATGYDTNSQRLLDHMNKGVRASDYQAIVDNLHDVGIELRLSLLGGLPGETEEDIRGSEEFLLKNVSKIGIDVMQMLIVEPTTYLSDAPSSFGVCALDSSQLKGNDVLSYGRGFVGADYEYASGPSHQQRLSRFIDTFRRVKPAKNEQPLNETWVQRIDDRHVADLYGQKIYERRA